MGKVLRRKTSVSFERLLSVSFVVCAVQRDFVIQVNEWSLKNFLQLLARLEVCFATARNKDRFICLWIPRFRFGFGFLDFENTEVSEFYPYFWIGFKHKLTDCRNNRANPRLGLVDRLVHQICHSSRHVFLRKRLGTIGHSCGPPQACWWDCRRWGGRLVGYTFRRRPFAAQKFTDFNLTHKQSSQFRSVSSVCKLINRQFSSKRSSNLYTPCTP